MAPVRVFLSVGHPHLETQAAFLVRLERSLRGRGLSPWTLGRTDYDYRNPLRAIREAMLTCHGAAIIGLGRRFSPIAIDRAGSPAEETLSEVWTSTPWNHLEAGMAFQLELPLLILKDRSIVSDGILDQGIGEYLVYEFDHQTEAQHLSAGMKATIAAWAIDVRSRPTTQRPLTHRRDECSTT